MENVLNHRVKLAVWSVTRSSRRGPISVDQHLKDMENTPLWTASSQADTNNGQDRNNVTRDVEHFEDGNFQALMTSYDRQSHIPYMVKWHNATQISILGFLEGRISTPDYPIPRQPIQPHNLATSVSPDNTLSMVKQIPQRQKSDSTNRISRPVESIASFASQKRPLISSVLFAPTRTNALIFGVENKKFDFTADHFQTRLKMQIEMTEAMKGKSFSLTF